MFIFKIHYWRYYQFLRQFCTVVLHFSYNLSILTIRSLGHRIFAKSACLLVVELKANFLVSDFSIFPGTVFFRKTFLFLTIVSSLLNHHHLLKAGRNKLSSENKSKNLKTYCYYRFHRSIL